MPEQQDNRRTLITESIPRGDDADIVEQDQAVGDEADDADESWAVGIGQQWNADAGDVLEQSYPMPEYDDDRP
ncbi:MAG: hypothetical protein P4L86_13275 [Mycobacterium sp.]|nr:hypothetical protein [Mycobacterium sp.]